MDNNIKFIYERNKAKIITNDTILNNLRDFYSTPNSLKQLKNNKNKHYIPENLYAITPLGSFKEGMTFDIIKELKRQNKNYNITIDKDLYIRIKPFQSKCNQLINVPNTKYIYRDYQQTAILKCMNYGRCLLNSPTGSGKSLIAAGLIINIYKKYPFLKNTLLIVPTTQLVRQMYKDFIEYGLEDYVQIYTSGYTDIDPNKKIIISNKQYLLGYSGKKKGKKIKESNRKYNFYNLQNIDILICDEVHTYGKKNSSFNKYFMKYMQTPIRFGWTGTLPEKEEDNWNIKGLFGPVVFYEEITQLQNKGFLLNINMKPIQIIRNYNKKLFNVTNEEINNKPTILFEREKDFISNDLISTKVISKLVQKLKGNTLILFDYIKHGKFLFDNLECNKKHYIDGTIDINIREQIRENLEKSNQNVLVANSQCFQAGINIKNLQNIILIINKGKSAVKVIQSIGRGLRLNNDDTHVNVYDIFYNLKYSEEHFKVREKLYKKYYNIDNLIIKKLKI